MLQALLWIEFQFDDMIRINNYHGYNVDDKQ